MYEALCRQEVPIKTKTQSRLYCYYKMDRPYLRLAPFKIEIVRQNPLAVLFYDIMSDEEARIIQLLAKPKACLLKRSMVFNFLTGKPESHSFRIAKRKMTSWILFNIFLLIVTVYAEYYSSLISLKAVIGAERNIPVMINGYVEKELVKLNYLKKFSHQVQEHNDIAIRNGEEGIKHPINAFLLIKGMVKNWNKAVKIMRSNSADDIIRNMTRQQYIKRINYPTKELFYSTCDTDPNHPRANENIRIYESLLKSDGVQRIDMRRDIPPLNNIRDENDLDKGLKLIYEALCRQEVLVNAKTQLWLYCYYKMDRPYLYLAPFKVEIVRQNSLAILFYDIISDKEAQIIQMLAVPKACLMLLVLSNLNGSRIYNVLTGKFELPSFRIAKSARLNSKEHEIINRINRRLELATNLEEETAEDLTVHNYGIGGHFEPHLDCARISITSIAVMLFIINVQCIDMIFQVLRLKHISKQKF
ncbi:prolyl 4-Hydroxylase alpha-subunit, region [Onchocerca flexuosa]|uniref:Prolyl 4-Hydroxylase alpha-subunit, region n=1 Tax=Onchocerca flexuosa TaxID=387005 RepID=A0A238BKE9_9BILA|nr:prolyl 4-Hydroxylase alpha-subunit, region [Onchocerca flexuosa]